MNKILKILKFWPILILTMIQAYAAQTLAVLEIIPTTEEIEVSIPEMRHLSDELRRQAIQTLPKNNYAVLTRDNMFSLMPTDEEEAQCLAESCAVEIGRAIGAEYVSQGKIGRFGGELSLSIELYDAMSGKLLGSIVMESLDIKGLMAAIREQAPGLFANIKPQSEPQLQNKEEEKPTSELQIEAPIVPSPMPLTPEPKKSKTSFYIAISLDAIGAAALGFGIYQHIQKNTLYKDYEKMPNGKPAKEYDNAWKKADDARVLRDIGFITGGVLLAGGIAVHIWF